MSLKKDVLIVCDAPLVSGMALAVLKSNGFGIVKNNVDPDAVDIMVDLLSKVAYVWSEGETQDYVNSGADDLLERVYLTVINDISYEDVVRVAEMNPFSGLPVLQFGYPEHGDGVIISRQIALTYADDKYFCGYEMSSITGQPKKFLRNKIREYSLIKFAA